MFHRRPTVFLPILNKTSVRKWMKSRPNSTNFKSFPKRSFTSPNLKASAPISKANSQLPFHKYKTKSKARITTIHLLYTIALINLTLCKEVTSTRPKSSSLLKCRPKMSLFLKILSPKVPVKKIQLKKKSSSTENSTSKYHNQLLPKENFKKPLKTSSHSSKNNHKQRKFKAIELSRS